MTEPVSDAALAAGVVLIPLCGEARPVGVVRES